MVSVYVMKFSEEVNRSDWLFGKKKHFLSLNITGCTLFSKSKLKLRGHFNGMGLNLHLNLNLNLHLNLNMNYNQIGTGYNQTRRADPFLLSQLLELLQDQTGASYLDIGCGTGNYTVPLAQAGLSMIGVDPSALMLAEARQKSDQVQWLQGTAEAIPLPDNGVQGAVASLTIHHWEDLPRGFAELKRVVDGGRLVLFTSFPQQMQGYWLKHYFPEMMRRSILDMPAEDRVLQAAEEAGWLLQERRPYFVRPDLQDGFLYVGKHAPARYLNDDIRQGISSFRMEGLAAEIEGGLEKLEADIASGEVWETIQAYENEEGDYCFLAWR
jgi:ubiquinone/menaquinone biosynthesis C-methylase UbiE